MNRTIADEGGICRQLAILDATSGVNASLQADGSIAVGVTLGSKDTPESTSENLKAEYNEEIEELENENERLQRQLAATNRRVDEHQELAAYVEKERELQQRREERRDAPAWRRAKWWLLGRK